MGRFRKLLAGTVGFAAVGMLATASFAGPFGLNIPITNFTFDNDTAGNPPPQTTPSVDAFPQDVVYAVNPDTGGTILVNNAGSMTKAAVLSTSDSGIGESYIDTQFNVTSTEQAVLDFDIDIVDAPATGLGQVVTNAPNGQAFVIQAFNASASRIFRFVAAPTSASGGQFGMRDNGAGNLILIPGGTYTNGDTHHVQIYMDFRTQNVSVYLDGAGSPNLTVPMVAASVGMSEFFIFQNGVSGDPNISAFDNFITFIPEPASLMLMATGAVLVLGRKRKAA